MFTMMQKLCSILAPSGREQAMTDAMKEMITPYVDEVKTDVLGNVVGKITGTGENKKKILYLAHMDEVGFIVTFVEENGYIRFSNMGGPSLWSAMYQEVVFESGARGHIVPHAGAEGGPNYSNLYVDIGAKNKEEALKLVKLGDHFSTLPHVTQLSGTMIGGRPLDDRIGCVILLEAARMMHEGTKPYHDIYFAFTVQEESTANGSTVTAFDIRPDVGIALDVCGTGDTIGVPPMATKCGDGAAILIRDSTLVANRELVKMLFDVAAEKGIKHQTEIYTHGGTDAVPMQKVALGAKAGVISIPMRYLHTAAETLDLADAEACRDLVVAFSGHQF